LRRLIVIVESGRLRKRIAFDYNSSPSSSEGIELVGLIAGECDLEFLVCIKLLLGRNWERKEMGISKAQAKADEPNYEHCSYMLL
jgi:hypothetical protein